MCNITPVEVEIMIRPRKFHRKLFDLVGDTAVGVVFRSLSDSEYGSYCDFTCFLFFLSVRLCCLHDEIKYYNVGPFLIALCHQHSL